MALSASYLSAVADRFGFWPKHISVWGDWDAFVKYTQTLNPFIPERLISPLAVLATAAEIVIPIFLILGIKTKLFANLSGILLSVFAICMSLSLNVKAPLDYSVFTAAAASFALANIKEKFLEFEK